ncbi:MAG: hypothetical protein IRZ14_19350 [Chloroflexi bacterium]|nr:hypothetical protein [Chloroflexota bacterium]
MAALVATWATPLGAPVVLGAAALPATLPDVLVPTDGAPVLAPPTVEGLGALPTGGLPPVVGDVPGA